MNVLIVEDMDATAFNLKSLLSKEGFEVYIANDGTEALKILKTTKMDFIISDMNMHPMDGLTLAKQFRKEDKTTLFYLYSRADSTPDLEALSEAIGINKFISISGIKELKDEVLTRFREAMKENERVINSQL